MVLVDPENLADTVIEIVASQKENVPSSIGQLSGGKKNINRNCIMFAIYLIKPAPFCMLDEVDAPLDDANVGKFTNMIKKFERKFTVHHWLHIITNHECGRCYLWV